MEKKNNFLITFLICFKVNFTHSRRVASLYILYSPITLFGLISLWHLLFFSVFVTCFCYLFSVFFSSFHMLSDTFSLSYSFHRVVPQESFLKLSFHHQNSHFWQSHTLCDITILLYSCCCLVMSNSFATPWTVFLQVPLSMGFSRQEYWSGLPLPYSGDLSAPRIKLNISCLTGQFYST